MISVIIPTYNRPKLIGLSINSVLNQTVSDIELIVIDGSDNDITAAYVSSLKDKRIKYIKVDNQSAAHSRNIGIEMAKGEYIAFNDDDDEWCPQKAEEQLNILNSKICHKIVYSSFTKKCRNKLIITPSDNVEKKSGDIYKELLLHNFIGLPTIMLHKSCCIDTMFDEKMHCLEDWDWMIRLAKKNNFQFINKTLVNVKDTPNSLNKSDYQVKAETYKLIYKKYLNKIKTMPFVEAKHLFSIGNNLCLSGNIHEGRKYLYSSFKVTKWKILVIVCYLLSHFGKKTYRIVFKYYQLITRTAP